MSGAMRKMGVYLGLVEDDAYGDYAEPERAHVEEPDGRERRYGDRGAERAYEAPYEYDPRQPYDQAPARAARENDSRYDARAEGRDARPTEVSGADYQITTLHPRTYNEARTIGERFRSGTPVIMNLTDMDDADAKRLVDFSAGLIFGLHGRIERVTAKVFLLSPENVSVSAEDKARVAEGLFFNQS
ncbi:MAG: cell division protein SepF [Frankiaceae bacterium]|jgi:cell division inhibitor SepF|nr:cell division protein SepF [Frankiaceae bacterium]